MLKKVINNNNLRAIILTADHEVNGVDFITDDEFTMQVAVMKHPQGKRIDAHIHKNAPRTITKTLEVLHIVEGELRADFFDDNMEYENSTMLHSGDTIILISGGHGFQCNESTKMIEVKQGPFNPSDDKIRFPGINDEGVRYYDE